MCVGYLRQYTPNYWLFALAVEDSLGYGKVRRYHQLHGSSFEHKQYNRNSAYVNTPLPIGISINLSTRGTEVSRLMLPSYTWIIFACAHLQIIFLTIVLDPHID